MAGKHGGSDLELDLASGRDRVAHRWVQARPADQARAGAIGATVYAPEDPGDCQHDPVGSSLITVAATLGVALVAGERQVEATGPEDVDLPVDDEAVSPDAAAITLDAHPEAWTVLDPDTDD